VVKDSSREILLQINQLENPFLSYITWEEIVDRAGYIMNNKEKDQL